jgi:hypothetical protein
MQETLTATEVVATEASSSQVEQPTAESPKTSQEQLTDLINRRMGQFDVKISYADLKYIKNSINSKVEWKGPNEAYLIVMALLTIDAALESMDPKKAESVQIKLPASTIESINYFLTKISGKGIESAQRVFAASMVLRQPVETLKKIDQEIESLQSELKTEKSSDSTK